MSIPELSATPSPRGEGAGGGANLRALNFALATAVRAQIDSLCFTHPCPHPKDRNLGEGCAGAIMTQINIDPNSEAFAKNAAHHRGGAAIANAARIALGGSERAPQKARQAAAA